MTKAKLGPGTTVIGSGPAGVSGTLIPAPTHSALTIAEMLDGTIRVTGLQLQAGPATVGTSDLRLVLERSSLGLQQVLVPDSAGGEHLVDVGAAKFVVTTTFEGGSRAVTFTNVDPIVFRQVASGGWEFDPFDLSYDEPGIGTWALSFDGMLFE